jgi:NAD(P)-dependent dehydrogenase (short-subunit alcohol dehydrogenase family)
LIERGVISISDANIVDEDANDDAKMMPRIVFVSSESHRSAAHIDFESLGVFRPWSMRAAMGEYASSKLLAETWATELARRTEGEISVHSICPGAVDTDLAREAPTWAKPALRATMRTFFKPPEIAATPVVYLAAAHALEGETGLYFHVNQRKSRDPRAHDSRAGERLWEKTERLLGDAGHTL